MRDDFLSKINSPPLGLQNLLGNVNQGVNPSNLDPKVSGIVDLFPHWTANRLNIERVTAEVAGITGQGVDLDIPEGQIWAPLGISAEYELTSANDDTSFSCGVQKKGTGYYVPFHRGGGIINYPGTAGDFMVACGAFPDRFLISGGFSFRAQIDSAGQTTVRTMNLQVLYAKLTD